MSNDLQWLLIRNWNSYMVKGIGHPTFSREHGNLLNLHKRQYSGLIHPVTIKHTKGGYEIAHRKEDASVHHVKKGRETRTYKKNAGLHGAVKHSVGAANAGQRPEYGRLAATRMYSLAGAQRGGPKKRMRHHKKTPAETAEEA